MNRYVIAKGYSIEEMAQQVNEYAAQGYAPQGDLIKVRKLNDEGIAIKSKYMQPMWMQDVIVEMGQTFNAALPMVDKKIGWENISKETSNIYNSMTNTELGEPLENEFKVGMTAPAQPLGNVPSQDMIKGPQAIPEWQECEREYVEEIDRLNERIQVLTIDHSIMLNVSAEQNQQIAALEKTNSTLSTLASNRGHHIERLEGQINTLTAELLAAKERIAELDSALHSMAKLAANSTENP